MKYLLIYNYLTAQYKLALSTKFESPEDIEILYEFELSDLKVMTKILNNLRLEREISETIQEEFARLMAA